jgi:hypothetical protein
MALPVGPSRCWQSPLYGQHYQHRPRATNCIFIATASSQCPVTIDGFAWYLVQTGKGRRRYARLGWSCRVHFSLPSCPNLHRLAPWGTYVDNRN